MKKVILSLSVLVGILFFVGCDSHYNSSNYDKYTAKNNGNIYPVGENKNGEMIYVKGVSIIVGNNGIQDVQQVLYLYCDKEGHLLGNGNIGFNQQVGKTQVPIMVQ